MTNTDLLREKISQSGYKIGYIADRLDLSRQGLYLKINGTNEFTTGEVQKICDLLGINALKERNDIFFANKVDK